MLDDEVWRLEKIGKDGAFNRKLSSQGIKTVQEFLKLAVVDTLKLRNVYIFASYNLSIVTEIFHS